jgi:serine/threonine protein kinase/tetratricopeptide (TPR) repeat protein
MDLELTHLSDINILRIKEKADRHMKCQTCQTDNPETSQFCANCGTRLIKSSESQPAFTKTMQTPVQNLTRGTLFAGRYEIIEELGKGGMGSVFRVEDTKIQEEVALKIIKPEIAADEQTIERFRNELKLARKIAHRNVCKMYDLGEEHGTHFITMEYVPGENLKSLMNRIGKLPVGKSVAIALQICQGLTEAHNQGVVHRDLKPQNIMIDKQGNAHIMDFGIARSASTPGPTTSGVLVGTPGYMAPEQIEGKKADQRSDIYALGTILFEMLTSRTPFEGETALAIAMKQKSERAPDPRSLNPQVPEPLSQLILKCLKTDPEERIQTTGQILSTLQGIEEVATDDSLEISPREAEASPPKKLSFSKLAFVLIMFAALTLVGYLIIDNLKSPDAAAPETATPEAAQQASPWANSIAVLPFRDQSPQKDQEHICTGLTLAINNRLTRLGDLKVISLPAVMHYKNREVGIKQIGRELGVDHILDGTLLREGNQIRMMGELIDTKSGVNLWSDSYEGKLDNIFELYDQVSQKVAEALKLELAPDAVMTLKSDRPGNMEAYEYYLKAMTYFNSHYVLSRDPRDFEASIQMFNRALELDPDYALAHLGLAWVYQHQYIFTQDPQDFMKVRQYIERADELDPEHPLTLAGKSWVDFGRGEEKLAIEHLKKALAINPNIAELNFSVGVICRFAGLSRLAIKYLARAHELDPYYLFSLVGYAANHLFIGRLEEAGPLFEKAYAMGPDDPIVAEFYSCFCIMKGDYVKAENILLRWENNYPDSDDASAIRAYLYAARGERDKALQISPRTYWFAYVYAELGMNDEAVDHIKKYLDRQVYLPYLKLVNQPVFEKLQDDPRFQEIVAIQKAAYEQRLKWAEGL